MSESKKSPPLPLHKGGRNKKGYKLDTNTIHKSKSPFQVQFSFTFTKFIKLASKEKQITPEDLVMKWVQQGINRDYLSKQLDG